MYAVSFSQKAIKELRNIDPLWQKRIKAKIEILAKDPSTLSQNTKPLKGKYTGLARLRVGNYRIIFQIKENELVILIVRIAHRQSAY